MQRRKRWLLLDRHCEGCLRRTSQQSGERRADDENDFHDEWQWHLLTNRRRIDALSLVDLGSAGAPCSTPEHCSYACLVCGLKIRCDSDIAWGRLWSRFARDGEGDVEQELESHRKSMALLRFAAQSGAVVLKRWNRAVHSWYRARFFSRVDLCSADDRAGALPG